MKQNGAGSGVVSIRCTNPLETELTIPFVADIVSNQNQGGI
jgi:hypothetical protein